jgi:hypothetical protein
VLHLDEAHSWSVPFNFQRALDTDKVALAECRHYLFIALTEVLEELRASAVRLKIFVTGTNTFLDKVLRFVSNVSHFLNVVENVIFDLISAVQDDRS